jgi:pyridoxine 5-phosphate synthase
VRTEQRRLGVNIDHIATIRQARRAQEPDPVHAALLAELGGAHGITVHLRSDRRHIQDRDVLLLRQTVRTRLNVEMAATDEMMGIAIQIKPEQVTLVPERPSELTTEGGLDAARQAASLRDPIRRLQGAGIEVSLFVDPMIEQVRAAAELEADAIEINTAAYAEATTAKARSQALEAVASAARKASTLVHVGHGLNYMNVRAVARIGEIVEFNIGHSIVSRAALVGMERAVREMLLAMQGRTEAL